MPEQTMIKDILYPKRPRYNSINIYSSPRVFQQKIDNKSRPLCIYTGPIEANNLTKFYDQRTPEDCYLRQIDQTDGLIYQFNEMNNRKERNPVTGIV